MTELYLASTLTAQPKRIARPIDAGQHNPAYGNLETGTHAITLQEVFRNSFLIFRAIKRVLTTCKIAFEKIFFHEQRGSFIFTLQLSQESGKTTVRF
jgi:hypothetical protein